MRLNLQFVTTALYLLNSSIRIPSSFCGVVGMKPTFGLVPYSGVASLEPTIDYVS